MKKNEFWMIEHKNGHLLYWTIGHLKRMSISYAVEYYYHDWPHLREQGYRVVKIRVMEVGK